MSDYNVPVLATAYADVLDNLKDRDVDALTLQKNATTNSPTGAIKLVRTPVKFQEFSAGVYSDLVLSITGGGTGASTAAGARTSLGLGSMAVQDSIGVSITGGSITSGASIDAGALNSGLVTQARLGSGSGGLGLKALFDDQTYKTVGETNWTISALQSVGFAPSLTEKPTAYICSGTFTITPPTVVGNGGKRFSIVNVGIGVLTIDPDGSETINGATTYSFDFGQYSSITFIADANNGRWLIF